MVFKWIFGSTCSLVAKSCLTLLWLRGLDPAKLPCPWGFLGKKTEVDCLFLLQGVFPGPVTKLAVSCLSWWILYHGTTREAPGVSIAGGIYKIGIFNRCYTSSHWWEVCVWRGNWLTLIEVSGHYFSGGKLENWVKCFMQHFVLLRWLLYWKIDTLGYTLLLRSQFPYQLPSCYRNNLSVTP